MKRKLLLLKRDAEFEKFYRLNLPKVVSHVYHKINDSDIAEDIAQEVFCVALVKWDKLKNSDKPLRWLFQTANYKLKEIYRKISNHPMVYLEDHPSETSSKDMGYEMSELELSALGSLKESDWDLFKKHYFHGYTIEELAKSQGVTPNNMRVRLTRIRTKLKNELDK